LLLAAFVVPAFFYADAAFASTCPYEEPHKQAGQRWDALDAQRDSTDDLRALCRLIPQLAEVEAQLASNQENAAKHPGCKVHNDGASAAQLRARVQEYNAAAQRCQQLLAAPDTPAGKRAAGRSSGSCSDITGTSSGGAAPDKRRCKAGHAATNDARTAARNDPAKAKTYYREAAELYVVAGDFSMASAALQELAALSAGRSVPPPAASAEAGARPFKLWVPTQENPDCESANASERATAAWYVTCVEPVLPKATPRYQHPIDPQTLFLKAKAACGSASRENYDCYVDAKTKYILENDPRIRAQCESDAAAAMKRNALREDMAAKLGITLDPVALRKNALISCVDSEYLYGPDGPPSLRDTMKARIKREGFGAAASDYKTREPPPAAAAHCRPGAGWAPYPCCQPGFGMKPTPGGFGSWSCQKLGNFNMGTAKDLEDAERRVDDVAMLAVAATDRNLSKQLDEPVRDKCAGPVSAAVRSVMKGGVPIVPDRCQAFADAARSELAYYASRHIEHGSADIEELLAYLPRGNLGAPQPGVQDLTADQRMVREAECMARGGSPENCVAANDTSPPAGAQSALPPKGTFVRGGISP
jgi:hypothetical protein